MDASSNPRPAATIVLARAADRGATGSPDGVEVLVVRRSMRSRVGPGFVVFPGGVLADADGGLAREWFGSESEAARACAVRELAEEAGIRIRPDVASMPRIARWIAPQSIAARFDAMFFAASGEELPEPVPDGAEVDEAWWAEPSELLRSEEAGNTLLAWPTRRTLEAVAGCATVGDVLSLRVEQEPPPGRVPP